MAGGGERGAVTLLGRWNGLVCSSTIAGRMDGSRLELKQRKKFLAHALPSLEGSELEELLRISIRVRFNEGELIVQEGSYAAGIYAVESGLVSIGKYASKGWQKRCLRFLAPGEWFGLEPVFLGREPINAQFAKAIVKTTLIFFERSNILAFSKSHSAIFADLCRWLSREVLMLEFKLTREAVDTIDRNLALLLIALTKKYGEQEGKTVVLDLPVSRQMMAEVLGVSIETLSRVLRQFRERGLIATSRSKIVIKDLESLKEKANARPFYLSIIEETL